MHSEQDPQHDRRLKGGPDYDELRDYFERKDDDRTVPAAYWIIPGLIVGLLFWAAMSWLAGPAILGMADASVPVACRDARPEIVACAQGLR